MISDISLLLAQEYIFSLGCNLAPLSAEKLPVEGVCYRSLQIAAFNPAYVISLLLVGDMAELEFYAEESCSESVQEVNAKFRWERTLAEAFENKMQLPTELPANFCFVQAKAALNSDQISRLHEQMASIEPLSLRTSEEPVTQPYRDGKCFLGGTKIAGQQPYTFCLRNGDIDSRQSQYHRTLAELAVNTIQESRSARILRNMRFDTP